MRGLFSSEIADTLNITARAVKKRADKENWPYRLSKNPTTGRKQPRYYFDRLPLDVQDLWVKKTGQDIPSPESKKSIEILPFDHYPEKDREVALQRQKAIIKFEQAGLTIELFVQLFNEGQIDQNLLEQIGAVSVPKLSRWEKLYTEYGLSGLCPQYSRRDRKVGERSLSEDDKKLIMTYYLVQQKPPLTVALTSIERIHGKKIPYHTANRFIATLPNALITLKRDGEKKYNDRFEPYIRRDYTKLSSMEWICSDQKTFDFLVTDGSRLFRPTLTGFIDLRSRKFIGWHIDDTGNTLTILSALEHVSRQYGLPENIYIDNGKDYKSKALQGNDESVGVLQEIGCTIHHSLPYRGQSKPIERFFNTLSNYFDKNMPSYVGSDTVSRSEETKRYYGRFNKKEKIDVTLTLQDVRVAFSNFIAWWNANHSHRGQGMSGRTPDYVFQANWKKKRTFDISEDKLRLVFSQKIIGKKVLRNGISIDNLDYYSDMLFPFKGEKVIVRRPVRDIGTVYIYDMSGKYLCDAKNDAISGKGVTAMDLHKIKKIRQKESSTLREQYGWLKSWQQMMPTMEDHLLQHTFQSTVMEEPKEKEKVVGLDMPQTQEERRGSISLVKGKDKASSNIEMLF